MNIKIDLDESVVEEFEYIVALHKEHGASNYVSSVEELIKVVLSSVADGSIRPGSWERQMLESMGLIADCDDHHMFRNFYGSPEGKHGIEQQDKRKAS